MAHFERTLVGEIDDLVAHMDAAILRGSATARLEDTADVTIGAARMVVRVYERYSAIGGNRLSLSLSVLAVGEDMAISAITAGGSSAMFFKVNTVGEDSFLNKAVEAIESYSP